MTAITLNLDPIIHLSLWSSSTNAGQVNRDVRFERTVAGKLISMPPTGGETGKRSGEIFGELWVLNKQQRTNQRTNLTLLSNLFVS